MQDTSANNKRIAKNTLFMYIRMLIIMVVSLYTSRVILKVLGVEDFGIYNIIGGVVVMLSFVSNAMATGTQRHLSYELGKSNKNMAVVFSACLKVHLWLCVLIFIIGETIGLWFVNTQMNIPEGRMTAVNWIYQFSVLSCLVNIARVPYNAAIIAYEKMSFYAFSSIVEAVLRLAIVFTLVQINTDKLILYGLLMFIISFLLLIWYLWYCGRNFKEVKIVKILDNNIYRRIISFSGWALFGSLANVGYQQGLNIIINIFFGVTLNASVGIANQANAAIRQFVSGFQQAINPQLTQAEASKSRERQVDLILRSSKFSFFIMFLVAFPVMANMSGFLRIWLGDYPTLTVEICNLTLLAAFFEAIGGPLWVTIFSVGNIKKYQVFVSVICLSILPIVYIGGKLGMSAVTMFWIRAIIEIPILVLRLNLLKKYIDFNILLYLKKVIAPITVVVLICYIFYSFIHINFSVENGFAPLLILSFVYFFITLVFILLIGMEKSEIIFIKNTIKNRLFKHD